MLPSYPVLLVVKAVDTLQVLYFITWVHMYIHRQLAMCTRWTSLVCNFLHIIDFCKGDVQIVHVLTRDHTDQCIPIIKAVPVKMLLI